MNDCRNSLFSQSCLIVQRRRTIRVCRRGSIQGSEYGGGGFDLSVFLMIWTVLPGRLSSYVCFIIKMQLNTAKSAKNARNWSKSRIIWPLFNLESLNFARTFMQTNSAATLDITSSNTFIKVWRKKNGCKSCLQASCFSSQQTSGSRILKAVLHWSSLSVILSEIDWTIIEKSPQEHITVYVICCRPEVDGWVMSGHNAKTTEVYVVVKFEDTSSSSFQDIQKLLRDGRSGGYRRYH